MKSKIYYSDIELLLQVFGPKNYNVLIFDPFQKLISDKNQPEFVDQPGIPLILVNLANEVHGYKGLLLEEFEMILDFGSSQVPDTFKQKEFDFINNPNGTMRWLFPTRKPSSALAFYNTSSFKSKLIGGSIKLAQFLKLAKWVNNGHCTINYQNDLKTDDLFNEFEHEDFSLFTGTAGYNRTPVFALQTAGNSSHFVKLAIDKVGLKSLVNEKRKLNFAKQLDLENANIPEVVSTSYTDALVTKNLVNKKTYQSNSLATKHFKFISELTNKTQRLQSVNDTLFWDNIQDNLNIVNGFNNQQFSELRKLTNQLSNEIDQKEEVLTSMSHSDFTPWNIKLSKSEIFVYDWEMSNKRSPALFDLIHFVFQTGIILQKKNLTDILEILKENWHNKDISNISRHLDLQTYLKLYLLKTVSYHLATFYLQSEISEEQKLQMNTWTEAIKSVLEIQYSKDFRIEFLKEFQTKLNKTRHAMLKYLGAEIESLPLDSDLDIAIIKGDAASIAQYCNEHSLVQKCNVTKKSFMTIIEIFFKNGAFLSIDLIHQIKRKSIQMMDVKPILISAIPNKDGIRVPDKKFDMEYAFLFYALNNSSIPLKYHQLFGGNSQEQKRAFSYLNTKYNLNLENYDELFYSQEKAWSKIRTTVLKAPFQSFTLRAKNILNYALDTIKTITSKKGFIITLSGVDGVGKSTIVKNVHEQLEGLYRKEVILMRHRPGILPILSSALHGSKAKAEKAAGINKPREGTNKNIISSILRFGYYYSDFLIGQVYIYFKYILRGKIVLYDRYYFDFIVDSKRSNITLNKRIIKKLYAFVYKPKLNILLWADPLSVYSRKKELEPDTIYQLTNDYKKLFTSYKSKYENSEYRTIENKDLEQTISIIMKEYTKVA